MVCVFAPPSVRGRGLVKVRHRGNRHREAGFRSYPQSIRRVAICSVEGKFFLTSGNPLYPRGLVPSSHSSLSPAFYNCIFTLPRWLLLPIISIPLSTTSTSKVPPSLPPTNPICPWLSRSPGQNPLPNFLLVATMRSTSKSSASGSWLLSSSSSSSSNVSSMW